MDEAPGDNAAQVAYWNDRAADTWTAMQERLDAVFAPVTEAALRAAAPRAGERVVDVGCGCGATVLALAGAVGEAGHVLGVDVSVPMTARARERVAQAGLSRRAEVVVADAAAHGFVPGGADLLFSRFGVMFFADPAAAFANLRRAMRPGGRMLCACWRPLAENTWFTVPLDAGAALLPPQPPAEPEAPGPFAFGDAARVERLLGLAGWREVRLARADVPMRLGAVEEATSFVCRVGALARMLGEAEPEVRAAVRERVRGALEAHAGAEGVVLGGAVWLLSAVA